MTEKFHANGGSGPDWTPAERIELLRRESADCRIDDSDRGLAGQPVDDPLPPAVGGRKRRGTFSRSTRLAVPALHVVASDRQLTQVRSWGGRNNGLCQKGSARQVAERSGFKGAGRQTAEQALQLLTAPNCPTGTFDLLLMPDQMMLQIHESIGHPLELDRILGDERNYAGTSFVTPDMFGSYRYGSELLNVTHDPTRAEELRDLRLRRRGQSGAPPVPDPRRRADPAAGRRAVAPANGPRQLGRLRGPRRGPVAGIAPAHRPDVEPEPGGGCLDVRADRVFNGRRHADADQRILVDRRFAQQVPVRLRVGPADSAAGAWPKWF